MPTRSFVEQAAIDFGLSLELIRTFDDATWKAAFNNESLAVATLVKSLMARIASLQRIEIILENRYKFAKSIMDIDQLRALQRHDSSIQTDKRLTLLKEIFDELVQQC